MCDNVLYLIYQNGCRAGARGGQGMTNWRTQRIRERAYGIWEAEGRSHGSDQAHWLQAEAEIPLRITFDSNAYRQAVNPSRSRRDASDADLQKINDALKAMRIRGYLNETLATLEGVQNAHRGMYFSQVKPNVQITEEALPGGIIKLGIALKPDHTLHPGLHPIVSSWIAEATSLGLKFLYSPRIGVPGPSELLSIGSFEVEPTNEERAERQERFGEVAREIETRGEGIAKIKKIGERIHARTKSSGPWYTALHRAKDDQEHKEIQKAVNEWADGDTVAAHIAYKNDYLCTQDKGTSAGPSSIFDADNSAWLNSTYGVRFVTLAELAEIVRL